MEIAVWAKERGCGIDSLDEQLGLGCNRNSGTNIHMIEQSTRNFGNQPKGQGSNPSTTSYHWASSANSRKSKKFPRFSMLCSISAGISVPKVREIMYLSFLDSVILEYGNFSKCRFNHHPELQQMRFRSLRECSMEAHSIT